jgi:hypothetical protein
MMAYLCAVKKSGLLKIIRFIAALAVIAALESFSIMPYGSEPGSVSSKSKLYYAEVNSLYETLQLSAHGLTFHAFALALNGMRQLEEKGCLGNCNILSIVDLSQSANKKRLYILDLETRQVICQTYVAHGRNSGEEFASSFSNQPSSNKSSLGFYVTAEKYEGDHGLSLRLEGMEKGINDNAFDRAIVIHGADYVSDQFIFENGRLGRSLGCPAVSMDEISTVVNLLDGRSCLFIYYPDAGYMRSTRLAVS